MRLLVEGKLTPLSPSGRNWNGKNLMDGLASGSPLGCRPMHVPG